MGIFDRFTSKKTPSSSGKPATAIPFSPPADDQVTGAPSGAMSVKARLGAAREKLDARDLPAAMAIYEEVLGVAGDRADVLVAISGDLGSHGHIPEIIELIAPRYAADRHGPATGLNLLQAYLAVRNADAAQHVLDILFGLNRPELEDRLHGFSNAIAELIATPENTRTDAPGLTLADAMKVGLVTISKPIWFYGLEPLAAQILPPKEGRLRRVAFAQLALPGYSPDKAGSVAKLPENELGRLSRAIPLWLAETFYFSPLYAPVAALGLITPAPGEGHYATFPAEWTTDNLRQLVDTHEGELDYIVTGALRSAVDDFDLQFRIWEVKSFRERKTFAARWAPSTADAALAHIHSQIRTYMEWSPASATFAYTIPTQPRSWVDTLGASLGLFLVDKSLLQRDQLPPVGEDVQRAGQRAATSEAASLAFLTLRARAVKLGVAPLDGVALARSPLIEQAQKMLG
jgi:hypothetical protein